MVTRAFLLGLLSTPVLFLCVTYSHAYNNTATRLGLVLPNTILHPSGYHWWPQLLGVVTTAGDVCMEGIDVNDLRAVSVELTLRNCKYILHK